MRRILLVFLFAIMLGCFSLPASATIQFVQSASANNQGAPQTSEQVSFASTTAGHLLVAYVAPANGQPGTISVSDDAVNTYSPAASTLNYGISGCNISQEFFYAANIHGGAVTITATTTSATGMALVALEYSGIATTSPWMPKRAPRKHRVACSALVPPPLLLRHRTLPTLSSVEQT